MTEQILLPILAKLEWIHESCDPEYKKQKEDAYYEQWRKSIVMTPLWFAIYKGFQQARNELIIMIYDYHMDKIRLLRSKIIDLKDDYIQVPRGGGHINTTFKTAR